MHGKQWLHFSNSSTVKVIYVTLHNTSIACFDLLLGQKFINMCSSLKAAFRFKVYVLTSPTHYNYSIVSKYGGQ